MASILVSGATGFVGRHVIPRLEKEGHAVIGFNSTSGDIADQRTWDKMPAADIVVHLASRTFIPYSWNDPLGFINTNLQGTLCCLEYCRNHKAKLIYSSSYLYGNPARLPIPESAGIAVNNPYGLSKKFAEESCSFYFSAFGVNSTILRPFNVYGPGQSDDFLIPMIIGQVISGHAITVMDLAPRRDYVYIDDLVNAIVKSVPLQGFHVFNIGSGISYSVKEVIDIIQSVAQTELPVLSSQQQRPGEIMDTKADISKALEFMQWTPQWSLAEGIENTIIEMKQRRTQ